MFQDLYGHGLSNAPPVETWLEAAWEYRHQLFLLSGNGSYARW